MKVVVHDGRFHPDDVFAVAILKKAFNDVQVMRSRKEHVLNKADLKVDVGFVYDPEEGAFDHHQAEGAGERDGIPYASAGLIWKHFGKDIIGDNAILHEEIDKYLFQWLDALDNGCSDVEECSTKTLRAYTIEDQILNMNALGSDHKQYEAFMRAVELAMVTLDQCIEHCVKRHEDYIYFKHRVKISSDKRYVVLDKRCGFEVLTDAFPELLYIVYPSGSKWFIAAVTEKGKRFSHRKKFPEAWAGLEGKALEQASGIKEVLFSHRNRFLVTARTRKAIDNVLQVVLE